MEITMSVLTSQSVTNFHDNSLFARIAQTFAVWKERYRSRQELARWSERELHDIGVSWSSVVEEIDKPFWRA
jgi:uncharacterized protein YjiS (DUF1127 family)